MPQGILAESLGNMRDATKNAFNAAKVGDLVSAFSDVGDVAKNIFNFVGFGWSIYEIYNLTQRNDLKPRQKILPIIGYSLAGAASLVTGVVLCAGATFLLPPLIFVGSVINVVRNAGIYLQERSEKKNLEKAFKKEQEIDHQINQLDLPEKLRHDIRAFIKQPHFDSVKIQELCARIANHYLNITAKEQQSLSDLLHKSKVDNLTSKQKSELRAQIKIKQKMLKENFSNKYGDLFVLLEQKQRLHFMKKSVKGRLANVFISAGVALISLVTTVLAIGAVTTPLAPASAVAATALGAASIGLSGVGAVNSGKIALQERRSRNKVAKPVSAAKKGIFPSLKKVLAQSKEKKRSDVLYQKSAYTKIKEGIKGMWGRLWKKPEQPQEVLESPTSMVQRIIQELAQKEFQSKPPTQEEMAIPQGMTAQRRSHYTAQYRHEPTNTNLQAQSTSVDSTLSPTKTPRKTQ